LLRENNQQHRDRLREAESKAAAAGTAKELEARNTTLIREIADARAHLDRDQRFQKEIRGGFCPILSEKCLNMKPGQTLETFLSTQFEEVTAHIAGLEADHAKLATDLGLSREAERVAATLDNLRRREAELKAEGIQLAEEKKGLETRLDGRTDLETRLASTEKKLADLSDPRSRIRFLETEAGQETQLRESVKATEQQLAKLEAERQAASQNLSQYTGAGTAAAERAALHALEKRQVESQTTLAAARVRQEQLEKELQRFAVLRKELTGEFQEKERLETVAETTAFIRDTLKEAAPRVARNYIHHVSIEANQMFREIMGSGDRSLKWADDYAVMLEEDGYERPFASLSGGEQMAAALSIRLALLKQLSDIRVAFFDEPTANMDAERRENFAQQISRITNFDQLFVISHDETFDNFVDNVVTVHRQEGEAASSASTR
jgi:exonuclease SbcC